MLERERSIYTYTSHIYQCSFVRYQYITKTNFEFRENLLQSRPVVQHFGQNNKPMPSSSKRINTALYEHEIKADFSKLELVLFFGSNINSKRSLCCAYITN